MELFLNIILFTWKKYSFKKAKFFLNEIPSEDCLIFVTARPQKYKNMTLKSLALLDIDFME